MAREKQHSQKSVFGEIVDWTLAPLLILWPISMAIQYFLAYNIADGSMAWRAYSTGPDAEMLVDPEKTTALGKPIGADSSLNSWSSRPSSAGPCAF